MKPQNLFDESIRQHFPSLRRQRNGKPPRYFDSTCMSLRPYPVIEAISDYYAHRPACGGHGRSTHWFSEEVNEAVDASRKAIAKFIGAPSPNQIFFVRNTTEGLNQIARGLPLAKDDLVVTTGWEHNSNICPWKDLEREKGIRHQVIPFNQQDNTFDLEAFAKLLKDEAKLRVVSIVFTSNLNGYTAPVEEILALCQKYRDEDNPLVTVLDAAQAIPYRPVNVAALGVDFLTFSLHKMCGPAGGVVYGKPACLAMLKAQNSGGGTIATEVYYDRPPIYLPPPDKFEAGLQDYAGIAAAGAAVQFLLEDNRLGRIKAHVTALNEYLTSRLTEFDGGPIEIVRPLAASERGSVFTFLSAPELAEKVFQACDPENMMYRSGEFCVTSWFRHRGCDPQKSTGARFSFYLYNTLEECELLADILCRTIKYHWTLQYK